MSFLKILSRLANLKYFLLVLSLIFIIPFTLLPMISSSHFPIISEAWAATYYVDATNGNNSNNGLSMSSAWKTIAKVNASKFNPGDQILFKRGETWREQLTVPSSGSPGSPITFGGYGSGALPIIKGSDLVTGWTADSGVANVWNATVAAAPNAYYDNVVRFDGTIGTREAAKANLNSANKWFWTGTTLSVYSPSDPDSAYTSPGIEANMRSYGIQAVYGANKNYITIQNMEIENTTETGLMIWDSNDNWIVDSCTIHNNGGPYGTAGAGRGIQALSNNLIVQNSTIYENADLDIDIQGGSNVIVQNNLVYNGGLHGIGFVDYRIGLEIINPIVRYNVVYRDERVGAPEAGILMSAHTAGGIQGYKVYYNIVYGPWHEAFHAGRERGVGNNTGEVYNNVFYNAGLYNVYIDGTTSLVVKNNIGYNSGGANHRQMYIANASGNTINYNCWYTTGAGVFASHEGTTYTDWATWKSATGYDTNSINIDPLFVNRTGHDFHLLPSSPCINAGTDVGLTRDYIGNNKWGANWDIGAYEWRPNSPLAAPPRNLKIIP